MLRVVGNNKKNLLTVRLTVEQLIDYKVATEIEGANMSGEVRKFVFKKIRDAKEREPTAFNNLKAEYMRAVRPIVVARTSRAKGRKQSRG